MSDIKAALNRKLGPLPAWGWLIIVAVGIIVWRRYQANRLGTATTNTSGEVVDSTATPGDPVTLSPGESVYDPGTGQLIGSAPEQTPQDPQDPVTLEPGESVYDPNTGKTVTNAVPQMTNVSGTYGTRIRQATATMSGANHLKNKPKKTKKRKHNRKKHHTPHTGAAHPHGHRSKKHKPQHGGGRAKVAPRPTGGMTRLRGVATLLTPRAQKSGSKSTPAPAALRQRTMVNPTTPTNGSRARVSAGAAVQAHMTPAAHTPAHPTPHPAPHKPAPRKGH